MEMLVFGGKILLKRKIIYKRLIDLHTVVEQQFGAFTY
jgi:hypothetical protein